jgi:glycine/D-amino acid oxidase-like deaminating enzyme
MVKKLNNSQYELVIVGAGVVGMGAAIAAQKQGIKKILIIDRHQACTGASIRNFGFITITGLRQKIMQERSLRSREIWLDIIKKAKININHRGLYLIAQHKESIPVLEEYLKIDPRSTVRLLWSPQYR